MAQSDNGGMVLVDVVKFNITQAFKLRPSVTTQPMVLVDGSGRIHIIPAGSDLTVPVADGICRFGG